MLLLSSLAGVARAQEDRPTPLVRVRSDTVLRWAPRHVLTAEEGAVGEGSLYWRRVDQVPVYERLSLDARRLVDGSVEAHISAWGAFDIATQDEGELVAGDFATAYGRVRRGPVGLWAGRRFITWGLPGGLHLDGIGGEAQTDFGLRAEAMVGRPVTPVTRSILGPRGSFRGPTLAYGARLAWAHESALTLSGAYVERIAEGIAADRTASAEAIFRPHRRLEVNGGAALDVREQGVEQGRVRVIYDIVDELAVEAGYDHVDPQRLLPAWSILSVFATGVFDEGQVGVIWRPIRELALRGEVAGRYTHVPGLEQAPETDFWGYRADALVKILLDEGRTQVVLDCSRRDDGLLGHTVLRAAGSVPVTEDLRAAVELVAALDDESDRDRDSFLARLSAEMDLGSGLEIGVAADVARTPIAEAEIRSLLRLGWSAGGEEGRP